MTAFEQGYEAFLRGLKRDEMTTSREYCNRVALHNKEVGVELERKLADAEQRIAKLKDLLRGALPAVRYESDRGDDAGQQYRLLVEKIDAALNPKPERHYSDCATNNRGVPELLGPCDCGYEGGKTE